MNQRTEQIDAILRLVGILDAIGIEYVITGSFAGSLYANPRMTRDVDILINPRPDDRVFLERALTNNEFAVFPGMIREAFARRSMFNIIDERRMVKFDIIVRDPVRDPDEVFSRAVRSDLRGDQVNTISREDLVVSKLRWARESHSAMQLRDVHELLQSAVLDEAYLSRRVDELDLDELLTEARHERHAP